MIHIESPWLRLAILWSIVKFKRDLGRAHNASGPGNAILGVDFLETELFDVVVEIAQKCVQHSNLFRVEHIAKYVPHRKQIGDRDNVLIFADREDIHIAFQKVCVAQP